MTGIVGKGARNTQQSSDMVERVARIMAAGDLRHPRSAWTTWTKQRYESLAASALEACHHEELVEALERTTKIARALARGHSVFPGDVAALNASDALLAKIGGES